MHSKRNYLILFSCCFWAFTGWLSAQNTLKIDTGFVKVLGNTNLVLHNTQFINNGTFDAGSGLVTISGNGTNLQSAIGGDSITTFHNLQFNKSANGSQLLQDIAVSNEAQMVSGNLDLNGKNLTLGTTSGRLVGESVTSRIMGPSGGFVQKSLTLNMPNNQNPGNLGCVLTSNDNIGPITIRRGHLPQQVGITTGIARFYEFVHANTNTLAVSVRFNYFDAELNDLPENELAIWRKDNGFWFNPPTTGLDVVTNEAVVNSLNLLTSLTMAPGAHVGSKVFLEGPYSTSGAIMADDLRSNNLIPLQSPYTGAGYNVGSGGGGESISAPILAVADNDAIVDWVFVEMRSTASGNAVVSARSGLLQKDGDIVDLDGQSPLSFPRIAAGGSYFFSIRHRNHVGIRSLNPISASTASVAVDFTFPGGTPILEIANGIKLLSDGNYALFSGDFSEDGQVQLADDGTAILPFLGQSGYLNGDLDLNGQVQNNEVQLSLNPNLGRGAQFAY
ncbi:MAG: hypothetical protein AAFU03_09145 [Bacteroidota bacterium]